jgi:O-succinylbenzoate synthase
VTALAVPVGLARTGIDGLVAFSVGMRTRFRGIDRREGLLVHGPAGWGEWSPFVEYPPEVAAHWLRAAIESATIEPPAPRRAIVPVNVTVPAVGPEEAAALVRASGASTAKVKVAEPGGAPDEDVERIAAVRGALGPEGRIRIDANAAWDVDEAVAAIVRLEAAAGGLEYVEQPVARLEDLRVVRARTGVPIAADEALRLASDPFAVDLTEACDIVVLKVQPLGGVRRALRLAEAHGKPAVVSSAVETSIGLAAGVLLAAALPTLDHACGLGTATLLDSDVVARPLVADGGALAVDDARRVIIEGVHADGASRAALAPSDAGGLVARLDAALEVLERRGASGEAAG